MSIFSKIMTKVFAVYPDAELKRTTEQVITDKQRADLHKQAAGQTVENPPEAGAPEAGVPNVTNPTIKFPDAAATSPVSASPVSLPTKTAAPTAIVNAPALAGELIDVAASLDKLAKENEEDLDWKKSIVDLLKLLQMDSSLSARKELAEELGYTGDKGDSATMNTWLHKQVLVKLSENGGKVPASLIA